MMNGKVYNNNNNNTEQKRFKKNATFKTAISLISFHSKLKLATIF